MGELRRVELGDGNGVKKTARRRRRACRENGLLGQNHPATKDRTSDDRHDPVKPSLG